MGYDIAPLLDPEAYVEGNVAQGTLRLYVVQGVPNETQFVTHTKKEIGEIAWHKLKDLPHKREDAAAEKGKPYWMVAPFIAKLRKFLNKRREEEEAQKKKEAQKKPSKAEAKAAKAQQQQQQQQQQKGGGQGGAAGGNLLHTLLPGLESQEVAAQAGPGAAGGAAPKAKEGKSSRSSRGKKGRSHPFLGFAFDRKALVEALTRPGSSG